MSASRRHRKRRRGYLSDPDTPPPESTDLFISTNDEYITTTLTKGRVTPKRVSSQGRILINDKLQPILPALMLGETSTSTRDSTTICAEETFVQSRTPTSTIMTESLFERGDDSESDSNGSESDGEDIIDVYSDAESDDPLIPATLSRGKKSAGAESSGAGHAGENSEKVAEGSGRRKRINVLKQWLHHRAEFLHEILALEYPTEDRKSCSSCGKDLNEHKMYDAETAGAKETEKKMEEYCCEECRHECLCRGCIIQKHRNSPLHVIKEYNGFFWKKKKLFEIGLVHFLGHNGGICPNAGEKTLITVIDIRGIQKVAVRACNCEKNVMKSKAFRLQLLRDRFYPATITRPETVATFDVLDFFEHITYQGKLSAHDFYQALVNVTDNMGIIGVKKRYDEFLRMAREYRHLQMLKRSGIIYGNGELKNIRRGQIALKCAACPHAGINIPDDWNTRIDAWIYTLYIMVDANFRLKHKARSKDDVELGDGWSYFVEQKPYEMHLKNGKEEKESKHCTSGMRAIDLVHLRGNKEYDASGVVAIQCRHMVIRPNGVGDLQKGERRVLKLRLKQSGCSKRRVSQLNVDYIVLMTLMGFNLMHLVISYDIACQYSVRFGKRMEKYSLEMQLDLATIILLFVIPKFHLPGHGESCQSQYSLNLRKHVGRTDGENIERGWANLNPLSMSVKEMSKGSRHDAVNEHIHFLNFKRNVGFGKTMLTRLKDAQNQREKHRESLAEFSTAFTEEDVKEIKERMEKWEANPKIADNPYREKKTNRKFMDVKAILGQREAKEAEKGKLDVNNISESHWLAVGIELEELQVSVKSSYKNLKETKSTVRKDLLDEKNAMLKWRLKIWLDRKPSFMPGLDSEEQNDLNSDVIESSERLGKFFGAWEVPLTLPSALSKHEREKYCLPGLAEKERCLREAQAFDILDDARGLLRKGFRATNEKIAQISGTSNKTITRSNLATAELKKTREVLLERYERARKALDELDPEGEWKSDLKIMTIGDLIPPERMEDGVGDGRHTQSWIWKMTGVAYETREETSGQGEKRVDGKLIESMCIEWARAKARCERWEEEVILLKEEMRRIVVFISHSADMWIRRARLALADELEDRKRYGLIAYANKQAWMLRSMASKFQRQWNESKLIDVDIVISKEFIELKSIVEDKTMIVTA